MVDPLQGQDVPVTTLIDRMLDLHGDDYLGAGSWASPAWPPDTLVQSTDRWMTELGTLLPGARIFGRIALVGWCLLDDRVASAAQSSGVLSGVAGSVYPDLRAFFHETGLLLLRRRAPLAALAAGELAPVLELRGIPEAGAITHLALGSAATMPVGSIGTWAAAAGGQVFLGHQEQSRRVLPEEVTDTVLALAFSGSGRLHAVSRHNLYRIDPISLQLTTVEGWPSASAAAVDPRGVVVADEKEVYWAVADAGDAVSLGAPPGVHASQVATAASRVAVLTEGEIFVTRVDSVTSTWSKLANNNELDVRLTATPDHVYDVTAEGHLRCIPWKEDLQDRHPTWSWDVVELGQPQLCTATGQTLAAFASEDRVTILAGPKVVASFRPDLDEGQSLRSVGLSYDGSVLAVSMSPPGLRFWRIDSAPEVRLSSYTPDTPEGQDLLAIKPTVDALAAILVAKAVQPPVAIGLFGEWGSGKTFFMKQLEARIQELSDDARWSGRTQRSLWAWRNVTQVSFNAWHYAAADVWAGLLEHLVRVLAQPRTPGGTDLRLPDELASLQQRRVATLASALDTATHSGQAVQEARALEAAAIENHERTEQELGKAQEKLRRLQSPNLADVAGRQSVDRLRSALEAADLPVAAELGQTIQDIKEARAATQSAIGLLARGNRRRLLAGLLIAWVLGVGATLLLDRLDFQWGPAVGLVTAILGAVGVAARWITAAAAQVVSEAGRYDDAEQAARTVEAELSRQLTDSEVRVEELTREVTLREEQRRAAQHQLEQARASVVSATPGALLMEYLEGRATEGDYRAQLGLIGTVRSDLQLISDAINQHNVTVNGQADTPPDDVVNRIVLYIDDLDRCRPEVVVKVLEAVSMLLTFPMFVVVVAVDAQWISRSLAKVYPEMLSGGDVTPDHYLEKIFQLPVWLSRPSDDAASAMARVLLGAPAPSAPLHRPTENRIHAAVNTSEGTTAYQSSTAPERGPRPLGRHQSRIGVSTSPPTSVILDASESAGLQELAPLVSRSPRALKRFINTYRVLKALVPLTHLTEARLILAVATSRPALGERLLQGIIRAQEPTLGDLVKTWPPDDQAWMEASIPASYRTWPQWRCANLQAVVREVRRFVFHVEPVDRSTAAG
ncbi:P-loop NTPase fold protein [Ornithinimicrobium sufpigmenti]|uniref:P-loop NTPase fold protein n=1 Tax=Ornithinimicrobium sufpigmenti TaxID=2508882 RepID=UPI0011AEB71A|nr:P-loop NTPase fold protein [Ornithinimicrobium sp. HY006]